MDSLLMKALSLLGGRQTDTPRRRPKVKKFTDEDQRRIDAAAAKRARRLARNSRHAQE